MNINRLLETLEKGGVLVHHEVDELRQEIQKLQRDAERYRWLTKYTAHLFMVTPEGLDVQMDKAMYGREK
jgi:hypothetical protein